MKALMIAVTALIFVAASGGILAVEIPIQNAGFEDPVLEDGVYVYPPDTDLPGWDTGYYNHNAGADPTVWNEDVGDGDVGIWNPDAGDGFPGGAAPEGQNIGYSTSYNVVPYMWDFGFSQTLPAALQANMEYVLSAQVGNSFYNGSAVTAPYRFELLAGDVLLHSETGESPGSGEWALRSMTYSSGPNPAQFGQHLKIRLIAVRYADDLGDDGYEVEFDAVSLRAESKAPFALTSIAGNGADLSLSWNSQAGMEYDILSTTDPSADPSTWTPLIIAIAATPPEHTESFTKPADPNTCFMVLERLIPPLFEDDFETDKGWNAGVTAGTDTDWERGTPTVITGGPTAAHSPATCYATNIDGEYGVSADVYLRSPEIDLTGATGASLNFWQFYDIETPFDVGSVRVLKAGDLTPLGADIVNPVSGTITEWTEFTAALPNEALGENIVLEFQFTSDTVVTKAGWYVDDVKVEAE